MSVSSHNQTSPGSVMILDHQIIDSNVHISKDIQIKILEEKLAFTQRQLEEKDRQIEHYKGLVKTMQELLESTNFHRLASNRPSSAKESSHMGRGYPPPGFEGKNLKGRKIHSFHNDSPTIRFENDEFNPPQPLQFQRVEPPFEDRTDDNVQLSSNNPTGNSSSILNTGNGMATISEVMFHPDDIDRDNRRQMEEDEEPVVRKQPPQLKKSRSHTSLVHLSSIEDSFSGHSNHLSALRASTSSLPSLPKKVPGSQPKELTRLKKSQSLTSVYSALDENRLDLKFPDLDQMVGQIYQLSKYQQGCRFLQKKLDEEPEKHTTIILTELDDHLIELMTDPFGNYLFTKLFDLASNEQRERIIQKILPEIMTVSFDMYGTQSMQKIMPILSPSQIELVVTALKPHSLSLIKHNKANYLIQYCLDKLSPLLNQWVYDTVNSNMIEVSRDKVGCVIVKRCIDHSVDDQRETLMAKITEHTLALVQDPFGNYVVQHVLQKFPYHQVSSRMIRSLLGHVPELCMQKFSSNVVEKCLKVADEDTKNMLLQEITNSEQLPQLLCDRFANFVVQTALDVADSEYRSQLVKNILPHLGKEYSPYTKRLQKKILQV